MRTFQNLRHATGIILVVLLPLSACLPSDGPPPAEAAEPLAHATDLATPRRIATIEGDPFQSIEDVTPDGTRLLMTDAGTGQLGLFDLVSQDVEWLTSAAEPYHPTWVLESRLSRDGARVAYHEYENETNDWSLMVRSLDGGEPVELHEAPEYWNYPVDWSPDGRHLLSVNSSGAESRLLEYDVGSGEYRQLRSFPEDSGVEGVRYTPDGEWIAYTRDGLDGGEEASLFMLRRDLTRDARVSGVPSDASVIGWSPDGRWILYGRGRDSAPAIFRQRVEGTRAIDEPVLVRADLWGVRTLGLDASARLVYTVDTNQRATYTVPLDDDGRASGRAMLRPRSENAWRLSYAPDGKSLFYLRGRGGGARPTIESLTTGTITEFDLPVPVDYVSWVRWLPDSKSMVMKVIDALGRYAFYRYHVQSAALDTLRVWNGPGEVRRLDVTPDGRGIVFATRPGTFETELERLDYLDLETLEERPIVEMTDRVNNPAVSPAGDSVVFTGDGRLLIAPLDGGEPRTILAAAGIDFRSDVVWHPDGRNVYVSGILADPDTGEVTSHVVRAVDVATGEAHDLDLGIEPSTSVRGSIGVHPDGSELSFVQMTPGRIEVWVLEDVFPDSLERTDTGSRTR